MGFIIGIVLLVSIIVISMVLQNRTRFDFAIPLYVSSIVLLLILVISISGYFESMSCLNHFKKQSEYFQTHKPVNNIEDAALTQKKIEYNEWLYNAQYTKSNYPLWTFLPDEVLDLKPIE